jgi:hypothetical protein
MGLSSSARLDEAVSRTIFRAKLEPAALALRIQAIRLAIPDESRLEAKQRAKSFCDQVRLLQEKYDATRKFRWEIKPAIPNHLVLGTEFERVVAGKDNPTFPVGSADCLAAIFLIDHMGVFEQTLFRAPRIHDGQEMVNEYQRELVEIAKAVAKLDESDRKHNLAACYVLTLSQDFGDSSAELERFGNLIKLHPQGLIRRIVLFLQTLKVDSLQIAAALDGDDVTFDDPEQTSTADQWSIPMTLVEAGSILKHARTEPERESAGRWMRRQIDAEQFIARAVEGNRQSFVFALWKLDPAFHLKFKGIERA